MPNDCQKCPQDKQDCSSPLAVFFLGVGMNGMELYKTRVTKLCESPQSGDTATIWLLGVFPWGGWISSVHQYSNLEEVVQHINRQGGNLANVTVDDLKKQIWWQCPFGYNEVVNGKHFAIAWTQFQA